METTPDSWSKAFIFFRKSTDNQGRLRQLFDRSKLAKYFPFSLFVYLRLFIFFFLSVPLSIINDHQTIKSDHKRSSVILAI